MCSPVRPEGREAETPLLFPQTDLFISGLEGCRPSSEPFQLTHLENSLIDPLRDISLNWSKIQSSWQPKLIIIPKKWENKFPQVFYIKWKISWPAFSTKIFLKYLFFKPFKFNFICMSVLHLCIPVYHFHVWWPQKSDAWNQALELQMVVICHVGSRDQFQALSPWNWSQCS